jgi:Ca2+-binding RTX toxin-like protein
LVFLTACDSTPGAMDEEEASADSPEVAALAMSGSGAGSGAFLGPDGLDLDNPHPEQACKVDVDWFRANPKRYLENPEENPNLEFPEGTTLIFVVSSDDYASGNGAEAYTSTIREGAGKVVYAQVNAGGSTTALTSDPRHGSDFDGLLSGTKGPDVIIAPPRTENHILGRKGDDCLFGGSRQDRIQGNAGNDLLVGYGQNDELFGEDGDDILFGGPSKAGIKPGRVDDDRIDGGDGNDYLFGGPGDDGVGGGNDDDKVYGNEGDDTVSGHRGDDEVYGGEGNDRIFGNPGVDVLQAGDGDDKLFLDADDVSAITNGNRTFEWINGGDGHDRAHTDDSGTGDDVILNMGKARLEGFWGGDGNDRVAANGVLVPVELRGGGGDDWLAGSIRNDRISGGPGNDRIGGNKGEDILNGGPGIDRMIGSANLGTRPDKLRLLGGHLVDGEQEEVGLLRNDKIIFNGALWTIKDAEVVRNQDIFITVESNKGDSGTLRLKGLARLATSSDDLTTAAGMQAFLSQFVDKKVSFDPSFALVDNF